MIAVLAAMLFIGIVTASMLKNTKSQSTASIGYGTMQIMSSTAKSGIIATETYVEKNATPTVKVFFEKVTALLNSPADTQYIYGSKSDKQELASGQFFRSRLINVSNIDPNKPSATFEITSGRGLKGKNLKKVYAFYKMGNVEIKNDGKFQGMNTFEMGGDLNGVNAGAEIVGYATFKGKFDLNQTGNSIKFKEDPSRPDGDKGNVFFNDDAFFKNKTVDFEVDAFFNKDAVFQNYDNLTFQKNVGFNKNVAGLLNTSIGINGNAWVKEGFKERTNDATNPYPSSNSVNIKGGSTSELYFTDMVPITITSSDCDNTESKKCSIHKIFPWDHYGFNPGSNKLDIDTKLTNFSTKDILTGLNMNNEANSINPLEAREDPPLNLSKITDPKEKEGEGKTFLNLSDLLGNNNEVTLQTINSWYNNAEPENYYNGHLLVKVDKNLNFKDNTTELFNKQIIFVVEDGKEINANNKFYNSGSNASTMVYVENGPTGGGLLNNFGCTDAFRGLLYIEKENSKSHTFQWGLNSSIDGAVLLKGGNLTWNTGSGGSGSGKTTITRNESILSAFAGLQAGGSSGKTAGFQTNKDRVDLKAMGYYFF